jgi:hypothetical protein
VYQSLAKLIKLCDEVLLQGEKALDNENDVCEVIQLLEGAVQVRWVSGLSGEGVTEWMCAR